MIRTLFAASILVFSLILSSCESREGKLKTEIIALLEKQNGTFAVAFKDLTTGKEIFIREHESFHAASTMKTPLMIEVFKQASEGKFSLHDSITIKNEFKSIVDGSSFSLTPAEDSEPDIYKQIGAKWKISDLVYYMITVSSNLATNILVEMVDAKNVTQTMKSLGARDMLVLRGVEDSKAYALGMNNTTTAYDLMIVFQKIAKGEAVNRDASQAMINILLDQKFNSIIPAKLPKGVKVSHKTGWLTGLHHDSGIVYLPDGKSYVLVLLSSNLKDEKAAVEAMATVSEMIYKYVSIK